jgi:hypothetical protein
MRERRKHCRRRTRFPAVVLDQRSDRFIGYVGNIAACGLMLVSDGPLEIGVESRLKIALPEEILGRTQFTFRAICLWSQAGADSCTYCSGFEFKNLSDEDHSIIRSLVEDAVFLRLIS